MQIDTRVEASEGLVLMCHERMLPLLLLLLLLGKSARLSASQEQKSVGARRPPAPYRG